jgi:hypothetical protein
MGQTRYGAGPQGQQPRLLMGLVGEGKGLADSAKLESRGI